MATVIITWDLSVTGSGTNAYGPIKAAASTASPNCTWTPGTSSIHGTGNVLDLVKAAATVMDEIHTQATKVINGTVVVRMVTVALVD